MLHPWDEGVRGTQVPILINSDAATLRCVAGPGSGKTFGLVRRVERILHPGGLGADALFRGFTRFSDFQRSLGVAPNVLANRLESFVEAGIMSARPASPNSEHREYVLTPKGLDFKPTVIALTEWGDKWVAPGPAVFEHSGCGGTVEQRFRCTVCGASPHMTDVHARARAPQLGNVNSRKRRRSRSRRSK